MTIVVIVLSALALAIVVGLVAAFMGSAERCARDAVKEIKKLESGDAEQANIGVALSIVGGIALLMLTLIGVVSITKGMGFGPMGKGIGILAFTAGAAALWAIYALLQRGKAKWLFAGLGVAAAGVAMVVGFTYQARSTSYVEADETIAELGQEFAEIGHEINAEMREALDETGAELFAATGERISLEEEADEEAPDADPTADAEGPDIVLGAGAAPLPDWTKGPFEDGQTLIVSEADLSLEHAREDARRRLADLAVAKYNELGNRGLDRLPEEVDLRELWEWFATQEFVDRRQTSVGDTFVVYGKGVVNEEAVALFEEIADEYVAERQRRRGLLAVSAGGGGVLLALSALYGALSLGGKRAA